MPSRSRSPRRRSPSPPRRRRDSPDYTRRDDRRRDDDRAREPDRDRDRDRERERDRDRGSGRADRDGPGPSGRGADGPRRPDPRDPPRRSPSPRRRRTRSPPALPGPPSMPPPPPRSYGGGGGGDADEGFPRGSWGRGGGDRQAMPPPPPRVGGAVAPGQGGGTYTGGGGGGGGGRDGSSLPAAFGRSGHGNGEWGQAGGAMDGGGEVSDEDIKAVSAGNFQEYRRLKRIKMAERNIRPFWRTTPSPPPDANYKAEIPKDYVLLLGAAALEAPKPQRAASPTHAHNKAAPEAGPAAPARASSTEPPADKELLVLDQEEADLFRAWLTVQHAEAAAAERAMRDAALAAGGGGYGDEDNVGPQLPDAQRGGAGAGGNFGGFLRPGEGERMAAYVASGKRIPRRGEVGLSSEQIEKYETIGYIMSGSRHSRMNAIRMRKENQIYTAEEKAALAMFNYEENKRKETKVLEDMKALVSRTLTVHGGPGEGGEAGGEGLEEGPPPPEPGA